MSIMSRPLIKPLILLYCLLPAVAQAQETAAYKEAIQYFKFNYRKAEAEKRAGCLPRLSLVLDDKNDLELTRMACELLKGEVTRGGIAILSEHNVSQEVLDAFGEFIAKVKSRNAITFLVKEAATEHRGVLRRYRYHLVMSLGYLNDGPAEKMINNLFSILLKANDPYYHVAVANALSRNVTAKDMELMFKILREPYTWEARIEIARAFRRINERETLKDLIPTLDAPDMTLRTQWELAEALKTITGLQMDSISSRDWAQAWQSKQAINRNPNEGRFCEVKMRSDRVLFLLDISETMLLRQDQVPAELSRRIPWDLKVGRDMFDPFDPSRKMTGSDRMDFEAAYDIYRNVSRNRQHSKLDHMLIQMLQTLLTLPAETQFNIIVFAESYTAWERELVSADWSAKLNAMKFMMQQKPGAGKALSKVLLHCYQYSAGGRRRPGAPPQIKQQSDYPMEIFDGPDTIVLVTDGRSAYTNPTELERFAEVAGKMNVQRKIRFHPILLGAIENRPFFTYLAKLQESEAYFY